MDNLENKDIQEPVIKDNLLPSELDNLIEAETADTVHAIITAKDQDELKQNIAAFNLAQLKKNTLRVVKLNSLLDKVSEQAVKRFEKRPDEFSNKDILDYISVVSDQINRSQKYIDTNLANPNQTLIQINKNNITINNNDDSLDRESRDKVVNAISALLDLMEEEKADQKQTVDVIDLPENTNENK